MEYERPPLGETTDFTSVESATNIIRHHEISFEYTAAPLRFAISKQNASVYANALQHLAVILTLTYTGRLCDRRHILLFL